MKPADLEELIATAGQDRIELGRLQRRLDDLDGRLIEADRRITDARTAAAEEQRDVDKLEHLSLSQLVAKVRGSHDQDLQRERSETYRAQVELRNQEQIRQTLQAERDQTQMAADGLAEAPQRYAQALKDKEQLLSGTDSEAGYALRSIAERRAALGAQTTEIREASAAVDEALRSAREAADQLDRADGWSTYDTFLGGGSFSSMLKHDRMDAAAEAMAATDARLRRVSTEVADVSGLTADLPTLQLDGFDRFVDVWFDNILTDLDVRQRIKSAIEQLTQVVRQLNALAGRLQRLDAQTQQDLQARLAERDRLLSVR